jgi:hypothetical protein
MRVSRVVRTVARIQIVIAVQQIVAEAAEHIVAARSAHEPIVAQIAEECIIAIGLDLASGRIRIQRRTGVERVEVQNEVRAAGEHDFHQRTEFVVIRKLSCRGIERENVSRIHRLRIILRQRFCAGDRVTANLAVQRVIAPTAKEDVVRQRQRRDVLGV